MKMVGQVVFVGDSHELRVNDPVVVFENLRVVCDYSEAGMWASSLAKEVGKAMKLADALELFGDDNEVVAWECMIARFFKENNIRTIKDLKRFIQSS